MPIHVSDVQDVEFTVTLFQGKYKQALDGGAGFPLNGIEKTIRAVNTLFDQNADVTLNERLRERVEEIHSFMFDEFIPRIRVVLCNNGKRWEVDGQEAIDGAKMDQVSFEHLNHDRLIDLKQRAKPVKEQLRFTGRTLVEGHNFRRVALGKVRVSELAALFERYGDKLLERNIRRYLGQVGRINKGIEQTLLDDLERSNFYFYNNGITIICRKFSHNELQKDDQTFHVDGLQVINGGQTCKTIQHVLKSMALDSPGLENAFVLVRLYELPQDQTDFVRSITYATNSQNPVDLRDLKSNDPIQKTLEASLAELGYRYVRYRTDSSTGKKDISSSVAAVSVLSVWRRKPQLARSKSSEHFGKLYEQIFDDSLNGPQVLLAVEIYRYAERKRKQADEIAPRFIPYASAALAMLIGTSLLKACKTSLPEVDHRSLDALQAELNKSREDFYKGAVDMLERALKNLHGSENVPNLTLHRLAGSFRRGDLMEELSKLTGQEN